MAPPLVSTSTVAQSKERRGRILVLASGHSEFDKDLVDTLVRLGYHVHLQSYSPFLEPETKAQVQSKFCIFQGTKLANFPLALLHLVRMLRNERPELVVAVWVHSYGLLAAIAHYHPLLFLPLASDVLLDPKRNPILMLTAEMVARRSDSIVCDSKHVASVYGTISNEQRTKFVILPRSVDTTQFHPEAKPRQEIEGGRGDESLPVILSSRWFEPIYDIGTLLRACSELLRQGIRFRIELAGDGTERARLDELAHELEITDIVHFAGRKPLSDMSAIYESADIYVTTAMSDGASMSLREAMATGLAVVATAIPGNSEWIEDGVNGCLFRPGDPIDLARLLGRLLKDDDLRRNLGDRARRTILERGGRDQYAETLDGICRGLMRKQSEH